VLAQLRFDDPDARRMEHDRIALLEQEQLMNGDGSFYGGRFTQSVFRDRPAQYETDTYANIALCYLLHRHGKAPSPTKAGALWQHLEGSWSSAESGWVLGRSSKLFTSFSWRYLGGVRPVGLFIPTGCAHMAEWMPAQLVGAFDVEGIDPRKTNYKYKETKFETGVSTTGEITYSDTAGKPLVSQQISYTALTGEGIAVVLERTTAADSISVKSSRAVNLAVANDVFNGSSRDIAGRDLEISLTGAKNLETAKVKTTLLPAASPWICVDDKLGIALLNGVDSFVIHDSAGRNAPWGSLQYDVITAQDRGERQLTTGDSILDSAFMLISGDRKTTARLWKSGVSGTLAENPSVRYVILTAPSGKRYLIVANLDGIARTVNIPEFPSMKIQFDGYGTEVREVE
jgi:hypothetical protein